MTSLTDAKNITSSLQRSRIILYKTLHGSETAVNQLTIDNDYINDTLNEHKYTLKSSLYSTKTRLLTVKSYELWEKYSLIGSLFFFFLVVFYIIAKRLRLFQIISVLIQSYFLLGKLPNLNNCKEIISKFLSFSHEL